MSADDPIVTVVAGALADWWDERQAGCYVSSEERPDADDFSMAEAIVAWLREQGHITDTPDPDE